MGAKGDEFDGGVGTIPTVGALYLAVVTPLAAGCAVEKNDQKITPDWATVVAAEIAFQRFAQADGVGRDHLHFLADAFLDGAVLLERSDKVVGKDEFHLNTSS